MINIIAKTIKRRKSISFLALLSLILIACEKDFVNIDSELQGAQNFNTNKKDFPLLGYSKAYGEVQTNRLPSNLLGYFNEPIYGKTIASVIAQVAPKNIDPDFGESPEIVSVKLNIPYFSTKVGETDSDGVTSYRLDSIFGNINTSVKLSIYQNNYLLRDLDPDANFEEVQAYYSNAIQSLDLNSQLGQLLYEDADFIPSSAEIVDETDSDNIIRTPPALNIELGPNPSTSSYWKNLILDNENLPPLSNVNNFKEFFRGLVFKIEPNNLADDSYQIMMDFVKDNANITINYTNLNDEGDKVDQTYVLNFSGVKLNTLENNYNFPLTNGDATNGDDKLYIKGGVGSAGIINLFNGQVENEEGNNVDALEYFISKKEDWLINQANLTVYVDQSSIPNNLDGKNEPNRLILYDLKNNVPIADYFLDANTINQDPDKSRIVYAEPLERDSNKKGIKYKFRITHHVKNILERDSTNVNLGIYVSTNVNLLFTNNGSVPYDALTLGSIEDEDDTTIDKVPSTCVLSPRGTVLYGSTSNVPENVRPKLEIFYTETKN